MRCSLQRFKEDMPEADDLKDLLYSYFIDINPSMPVIHIGTFDLRRTAWELILSLTQ